MQMMMVRLGTHEVQNSTSYAFLPQRDKHADAVKSCVSLHQMASSTMQTVSLTAANSVTTTEQNAHVQQRPTL